MVWLGNSFLNCNNIRVLGVCLFCPNSTCVCLGNSFLNCNISVFLLFVFVPTVRAFVWATVFLIVIYPTPYYCFVPTVRVFAMLTVSELL